MAYVSNAQMSHPSSLASSLSSLTPSRPAPPVPMQRTDTGFSVASGKGYSSSGSASTPPGYIQAGPGSSPSTSNANTIVRRGWVSMKEDGLRAFLWSKKWLILREDTLSIHKNEVRWSAV